MKEGDQAIYADLKGRQCVCGEPKSPGKSFCRKHYFLLPSDMRARLYERDGYPETFRAACRMLDLPEPTLQPEEAK